MALLCLKRLLEVVSLNKIATLVRELVLGVKGVSVSGVEEDMFFENKTCILKFKKKKTARKLKTPNRLCNQSGFFCTNTKILIFHATS